MRRISCDVRFPAAALIILWLPGCASQRSSASNVDGSAYLSVSDSLHSKSLVFGEAIRKCREAFLKAAEPNRVVDLAFWSVEAVPAAYGGAAVSTAVTAVLERQAGLETPTAAVRCQFGEKSAIMIAHR